METRRKKIIQHLEQTLKDCQELRAVGVGLWMPSDQDKPTAAVLPVRERKIEEPDGLLWMRFTVAVRVIVDRTHQDAGYELEDLLGVVEDAIVADPKRGGLADDTRLVEDPEIATNWLFLAQDYPEAGADLLFDVRYQRQENDPS